MIRLCTAHLSLQHRQIKDNGAAYMSLSDDLNYCIDGPYGPCMPMRMHPCVSVVACLNLGVCLVGRNLDVQSLHSARFPTVAFRLYLVIIIQPLTN